MRRGALPHVVTVNRREPTGTDGRNNATLTVTATVENVPARVDVAAGSEDIVDRDRTTDIYEIVLPATWDGENLELGTDDQLVYAGTTLEVIGTATRVDDHAGRPDHVEITARRIVG